MGVVSLQPSDAEEKWIQLVSRTLCRRAITGNQQDMERSSKCRSSVLASSENIRRISVTQSG